MQTLLATGARPFQLDEAGVDPRRSPAFDLFRARSYPDAGVSALTASDTL